MAFLYNPNVDRRTVDRDRARLLKDPVARLYAKLCLAGKQKEATRIIQAEVKRRRGNR